MAEVKPFCGELYDLDKVQSFEHVVAPPYDVISDQQVQQLRARSPHNIVHLLLDPQSASDTAENNRYTRTAEKLNSWREMGVLQRETDPALYLYEQQFTVHEFSETTVHTRRALVARVRLEPFEARVIFPHEKTLAAPKEDRLQLLRTCRTNLSSVFGLYSDPEAAVERLLAPTLDEPPLIEIQLSEEHSERLWHIADPAIIDQVEAQFAPKPIVIADGHHRYETSLFYRDACMQEKPDCGTCQYILMSLVRMESPGLVVLGIHRLLRDVPEEDLQKGWHCLQRFMEIEHCSSPEAMVDSLHHLSNTGFGVYYPPEGYALLRFKEGIDTTAYLDPGHSDVYNRLDVTRLHGLILKGCFDIDTSVVEQQRHVVYSEDAEETIERIDSGEIQLAFFLNPTRVDQVRDVAMVGETMPQKSTFFHPKLTSGLVLNPLD